MTRNRELEQMYQVLADSKVSEEDFNRLWRTLLSWKAQSEFLALLLAQGIRDDQTT